MVHTMSSGGFGDEEYVSSRVDLILSSPSQDYVQSATDELFRYLSDKRPLPISLKAYCLVAIHGSDECLADIVGLIVPAELRQYVMVAICRNFTDVIRIVRHILPSVLVINSNLLILAVNKAISACVAVSPNTRYVLMTGWSPENVAEFHKVYAPLQISMATLSMPFNREEFLGIVGLPISRSLI